MTSLVNGSVALDTSSFATNFETFTTLPILNISAPSTSSSLPANIFSDDDITLPELKDYPEYGIGESPTESSPFDFDPLAGLDFLTDQGNPENSPVESETPLNPDLDFLSYDFDLGADFETKDSENSADKLNSESTTEGIGDLDFLSYDFEFNFNDTAADTNGSSLGADLDLSSFADYNFDLFDDPKPIEEVPAEDEEYDFNDGWFEDVEYVEKTPEEIAQEDREFEEKWASLGKPPPVIDIVYNIDLHPLLLWGPPFIALGVLFLMFLPCIILMRIDDKRERQGKPRRYGITKIAKQIQKEVYQRTESGKWMRVTNANEPSCTKPQEEVVMKPPQSSMAVKEKPKYSKEEEIRQTREKLANRKISSSNESSELEDRFSSSRSNHSRKSSPPAYVDSNVDVEAGELTDIDLGDGIPTTMDAAVPGSSRTSPGLPKDPNWSLY